MSENENPERQIKGYLEELSDGRSVFVGWNDADPNDDRAYIHFINKEGEETNFCLSTDARAALQKLLNRKWRGEYTWRSISE